MAVALGASFAGCNYTNYESCPFYCWQSEISYGEIPENGVHPGYYDQQCTNAISADGLWAPIPALGLAARHCYLGSPASVAENTESYFLVKAAIQTLASGEDPSTDEASAYDLIAEVLDRDAYENCVGHLTCYHTPGNGCDIDPAVAGDQSCTVASAESLCSSLVEGLLYDLLDRSSPQQYPECSGTDYHQGAAPLCEGYVPDMNDTEGPCAEDGLLPGTGSTSMGGVDSTSAGSEPFGSIDALVTCDGNDCDIDPHLLVNIMENFSEFYDDGVSLEHVADSARCGPGVRVDGLSIGTAPTELANEFNIENGDIIRSVNDVALSSSSGAVKVLESLGSETSFTVVVHRPDRSTCTKTAWTMDIVP